ncbi:MAG: hypothetical protein ABL903_00420 [Methylococcales bacterium]
MKNHKTPKQATSTELPQTQSQLIELIRSAGDKRAGTEGCEWLSGVVDQYLNQKCGKKENTLEHKNCFVSDGEGTVETEDSGCACSGSSGSGHASKVDLIVLIDSSGSMYNPRNNHWVKVSEAVPKGIAIALDRCGIQANVKYLYVDRVLKSTPPGSELPTSTPPVPNTVFNQSHETYLMGLGITGPFEGGDSGDYQGEEGAEAVMDLAKHNKWIPNACRAILYISDESFATANNTLPSGSALATQAASVANIYNVTVFTHYIGTNSTEANEFQSLATLTGGISRIEMNEPGGVSNISVDDYVELLSNVICNGCGSKCKEVEFPIVKPCISISWGDSKCDCLETDDVEVLCITVCNCYSNLTFSDFSIEAIIVTDSSGNPVPSLPDGTPSVQILPVGPLCFGDIPPCKDGKAGCVSREVVLWTRGAKGGHYQLSLFGVCYDITNHYGYAECFALNLCQD